jgi:hypothetical protein
LKEYNNGFIVNEGRGTKETIAQAYLYKERLGSLRGIWEQKAWTALMLLSLYL